MTNSPYLSTNRKNHPRRGPGSPVARHVEVAGAGTRLPAARLSPDRLRAAIREAMGRRTGAGRIASAFAAAGGPSAAADELESLLDRQRSGAPSSS